MRNIVIGDGTDDLRGVLWGDNALISVSRGDPVEMYHGTAKCGRSGDIELHAGRDTIIRAPGNVSREVVFVGTVMADSAGISVDDARERYLTDSTDLPLWQEVRVMGTLTGYKLRVKHWEPVAISLEGLYKKMNGLADRLQAG